VATVSREAIAAVGIIQVPSDPQQSARREAYRPIGEEREGWPGFAPFHTHC